MRFSILKISLEGPAARWQNHIEETNDSGKWGIEKWLEELKKKFKSKIKEKEGDIITLSKMEKSDSENLLDFNMRFSKYVEAIKKELYTEAGIIKVYLKVLHTIDKYILWIIVQKDLYHTLVELMDESVRLYNFMEVGDNKNDFPPVVKPIVEVRKIENSEKIKLVNKEDDFNKKIDELTESVRKLTLLTQQNLPKRDYSNIKCYNCGDIGHTSQKCKLPYNPNNKLKYKESNENVEAALLTLHVENADVKKIIPIGERTSKRMRVEEIINNNEIIYIESPIDRNELPTVLH
ncbi:hypothetical protein AYI69_g3697 [Smittium culicis]|uniref:CCHC-type domain-containing protein n=1 Tax=Smittium culicis TaxID=133412 RepID=A0A1R1YIY5_9FUNG|nr:hypothetical protein AYI69_g3697 [Smittium culicis]